jgi:hypothetical protein
MIRKVYASEEIKSKASRATSGKFQVYSFFPVDKGNCQCKKMIGGWKDKLALLSDKGRQEAVLRQEVLICPKDVTGMNRYRIDCNNCNEMMGYCWSKDATLTDWCDLHYTSWVEDGRWHGCFGHHISPITEQLCWECVCGQDTRDFRANMTLKPKDAFEMEERNKIGREYGKADSKFKVSKVDDNVIPFKEGGS